MIGTFTKLENYRLIKVVVSTIVVLSVPNAPFSFAEFLALSFKILFLSGLIEMLLLGMVDVVLRFTS